MEDDGVIVAALGKGGEVGAGLRGGSSVGWTAWEETWGSGVDGKKFAYSGGMVRVEFEGYGALGGNEQGLQLEARSLANHGGVKDDVGRHRGTNDPFLDWFVLVHVLTCVLID